MAQRSFYLGFLILVLFASLFSALWEAGMLTIIGQFPVKYMQAYLAGGAVSGVVVITISLTSYFIAGTFENPEFAKIYFGVTTWLILTGLLFFWFLQQNALYKHYDRIVENVAAQRELDAKENLAQFQECSSFLHIFSQIREIAIASFCSATIGFIIFPEFMFHTRSVLCGTPQETWFHRDMFIQLALFLANICEVIGKLLPLIPVLSFQNGPYIWLALSRAVMIPFYLFGNVKIKGYTLPFKPYLADDVLFFVLVSFSALSSSYLHTVSVMWAPSRVKPHERSVALAIMVICSSIGFVIGTTTAMLLKNLLIYYSTPISHST